MTAYRPWMTRFAWVAGVAAIGLAMTPAPARAWWRGGWGYNGGIVIGVVPPFFLPPPVVYAAPPPVYYAPPPPPYYSAPAYHPTVSGQSCYAGAYVCPLEHATPVGANCSCPSYGRPAYGQVR
jgi:hypothetical protein